MTIKMAKIHQLLFMFLISISMVEKVLAHDMWNDEVCRPKTYFDLKFYNFETNIDPQNGLSSQTNCKGGLPSIKDTMLDDMGALRISNMVCCVDPILKYVVGLVLEFNEV
jgi:hypothetical protein